MTMTRQERWRSDWLRECFADTAGGGHEIDPADLEHLPAPFRARVTRIAEGARAVYADGDRQAARELARAAIREIDEEIEPDWTPPPPGRPDSALVDEIRRF